VVKWIIIRVHESFNVHDVLKEIQRRRERLVLLKLFNHGSLLSYFTFMKVFDTSPLSFSEFKIFDTESFLPSDFLKDNGHALFI
jgi:hypothetical protein